MKTYWDRVGAAADFLSEKIGMSPDIAVITGTGLGASLASIDENIRLNYGEIPGFSASTVEGHAGVLVAGTVSGRPVMAMAGRFHLYEGYSPAEVVFSVRVMRAMGISTLIVTNAAGGLNPDFCEGDIMIIRDHINLTCENPLVGPNNDDFGIRFPDMSCAYSHDLAVSAASCAKKSGISVRSGIYAGLKGPSLETPAEIRFLKIIGADAVGFSTVAEVIAAVHGGMNVLGLSIITNVHDPDNPKPASVDEIIGVAQAASGNLGKIISCIAAKEEKR
ncbi:MAG: purine-nucleoside phosphorylase [Deltaproteobacteria bacterium]|nr:purine-nucleoside phosphorylase [Deltaproteobacteria bacterium]